MGAKKFLTELLDANFNRFLAVSIIKILYVLGLVATTAVTAAFVLAGLSGAYFSDEPVVRILGPVLVFSVGGALYLLGALLSRLTCETIMIGYRVAENTGRLVEQGEVRDHGTVSGSTSAARSAA